MTFLEAVNRILRSNGIIRGDDDELASFAETQHSATSSLAQISVQDQLSSLISDQLIPFEESDAEITLVSGTRLYSLASDFIRFRDPVENLWMLRVDASSDSENSIIPYISEDELRLSFLDYRDVSGGVNYFYTAGGSVKQVGFHNVPNADENGQKLRYYYEKDVSVESAADVLPFHTTHESNIFVRLASRHFGILFQQTGKPEAQDPDVFEKDPVLVSLRGQLISAMNYTPASRNY